MGLDCLEAALRGDARHPDFSLVEEEVKHLRKRGLRRFDPFGVTTLTERSEQVHTLVVGASLDKRLPRAAHEWIRDEDVNQPRPLRNLVCNLFPRIARVD